MKYTMVNPSDQKKLWGYVAELPCQRCGRHGVQVSHSNQSRHGKGMGLKAWPFAVAALCPTCHVEIDSGKTMSRQERVDAWNEAWMNTLIQLFLQGRIRPV